MCCVYIRNVQHHIETAMILNTDRKEILVFYNREQLHVRLRQACTFETKTTGLAGLDQNCLALKFRYCGKIVSETVQFEKTSKEKNTFFLTTKANAKS